MEPVATFAQRLQELMDAKKITRTELASLCGVNKSNITRYLAGSYKAKQDVIYQIATRLDINPAWLMGYDIPMDAKEDIQISDEDRDLLLTLFGQLAPEARESVLVQLRALARHQKGKGSR